MAKFMLDHAGLFTHAELAEYLDEALVELEQTAKAGCSERVPDSEETCGGCASCVAAELVDRIDADTERRLAAKDGV